MSWLERLIKKPLTIGAIAPSSPYLAKHMAAHVDPGAEVLEIGPGDGAITTALLERISDPSRLRLVEIDPDLAAICRRKFPHCAVYTKDAEAFLAMETNSFDAIVSGIPFAVMNAEKRKRLFRLIRERLKPEGAFILFQYSPLIQEELQSMFGTVTMTFTPWNLPPAFVFVAKREREARRQPASDQPNSK